jgi:hypothetical protein
MNLSRRNMMMGGLGALGLGLSAERSFAKSSAPKKNLIVILVYGGWDVTYALDPKPGLKTIDVPDGKRETIGGIPIWNHASRPNSRAFFEQHGELTTIVNGIQVQSINHPDCTKRILTGTASETSPDIGAIVGYQFGKELPAPYLVLGPTAYTGEYGAISARTGTLTQVSGLMAANRDYPNAINPEFQRFTPRKAEASLIDKYVRARAERERATRGQRGYNARRVNDFVASLDRGDTFKGFAGAFGDELSFTLDLRVQIDVTLRAFEEGLSRSSHLEQTFAQWDTHTGNEYQAVLAEDLYDALSTLANELKSRPGSKSGTKMIDETVVAVVSEMSRTPKLNEGGGKDHWPVTSALFFGGGIPGGRSLGKSGDGLEASPIDFATGEAQKNGTILGYGNLVGGLLEFMNIDSEPYLSTTEPFHALAG